MSSEPYVQSRAYMDTIVTIEVPAPDASRVAEIVERAFGWFAEVEARCSRFDPDSELRRLCSQPPGTPVQVSPLLFSAIEFALAVAEETAGAFDPAIGTAMEQRGFNRNYRTGAIATANVPEAAADYRSLTLDAAGQTITLQAPLLLDLGAVAKGMAIDLAAAELIRFGSFLINAGGDILAHGNDPEGNPWRIGVKDPLQPDSLLSVLSVSDGAVCTSGGYERPAPSGGHHILSPKERRSPSEVAGVTVMSPSAMVSDALSTAAFVLGCNAGMALLQDHGAEGIIVDHAGAVQASAGLKRYM